MTRIGITFLLAIVGVTACGDTSRASGPVGSWTLDLDKLIDQGVAESRQRLADAPEAERKAAENVMGGRETLNALAMLFENDLQLFPDKTFTLYRRQGSTRTTVIKGSWTEMEGTLLFTPLTKDGQTVVGEDAEQSRARLEGGHLVLVMPQGKQLALKRK